MSHTWAQPYLSHVAGQELLSTHPWTTPCANWSRGKGDRREQGPGSSSGPQVSGVACQLDLGSYSCSSGLLTGALSCWQEESGRKPAVWMRPLLSSPLLYSHNIVPSCCFSFS